MNFRMYVFGVIVYSLFVMLNCANALGFDYLLQQVPELFESKVVLNVKDYGAKGDGIQDDTKEHAMSQTSVKTWMETNSLNILFLHVTDVYTSLLKRFQEVTSFTVTRITCGPGHGISIGSLGKSGICDQVYDVSVREAFLSNTENGLRIKTWQGGTGFVRNVKYENVWMVNVSHPIIIDQYYCDSSKACPNEALMFHKCNNLVVKNLIIMNGQQSQMSFTTCDGVKASRLSISAPASSPNTDGIHISESTNAEVKDTTIRTGDDCISIVSNSSKVTVTRITCGPGHGIRNVKYENVWMVNVSHPIIIDQYYCDSSKACPNETSTVNVENISYVNIKGTSANKEAIRFACSDVSPCEMLYLEDVELVSAKGGTTTSFCWEARGSSSGTGGTGFVRNVKYENVWMVNVSHPIIIDQYYCDSSKACPNEPKVGPQPHFVGKPEGRVQGP
nr:probable polygalacturonase At1g80170 isoform X1 [Tanacetum cinerariifolium]